MRVEKAIKILPEYILYLFVFLALLVFFKFARNFFPPPEITQQKIVGYAHYYGYPLYFDSILFFYILLCPVFAYLVLILRKKIWKK
ncbi:MAG: hypothetical protein A2W22_03855 [Candidatus Levybacteria bacterium RBG_16_35_11]|nr:MAG: hypothetical protein A2W22_03855 [Candidatus Levybacteria bacterium RBG_16_35_11]